MFEPNRREALAAAALGTIATVSRQPNRIKTENEKAGTTDWQLTYAKFDANAKYRQSLLEGYCSRTSVKAGEKIAFHISTSPASDFTIQVYRLGYYGGTGGRLMRTLGPFDGRPISTLGPFVGKPQHVPTVGKKRLHECHWEPSTEI